MVDWKKDISFGGAKKKEQEQPEALAEATESTSFWKKEISLGGGKKKQEADVAPVEVEPETAAPVELDAPAAVELLSAYVPEVSSEQFVAALEQPEPVVELAPDPAPELADEVELEQPIIQFPVAVPDPAPVTEFVDFLAPSLPSAPDTDPIDLTFAAFAGEPPAAEPVAVPVAPPAAAAPDPVVVHPPVPAAELPAVAEAEPAKTRKKKEKAEPGDRVPFYKRDLAFGK